TTDPMFYGINKRDYGVSGDKDMEDTPLYRAIARELREIEQRIRGERDPLGKAPAVALPTARPGEPDFSLAAPLLGGEALEEPVAALAGDLGGISYDQARAMLPSELINEEVLL